MSKIHIFERKIEQLQSVDWDFNDVQQSEISMLHPYPAKFIESIPRELIRCLPVKKDSLVLDPFCGSGTTMLEAKRAGFGSIGVDLNPIACLISRVKLSNLNCGLTELAESIVESAQKKAIEVSIPEIPNLDHWFKKDIQEAITKIVNEINSIKDESIRDGLMFSLSCIIVRVSNQESDTRYAAIDKKATAKDVYTGFVNSCKRLEAAKQSENASNTKGHVICSDILGVSPDDIDGKVGMVITSPPYPNAYEYWLYHKYRMWWLGYDPISVREKEIGARPHYQKKNGETEIDFKNQMERVFDLVDNVLLKDGYFSIVIGRSIIKGREINNAAMMEELAGKHGYSIAADIERTIAPTRKSFNLKYGKINTEHILVLRKGF